MTTKNGSEYGIRIAPPGSGGGGEDDIVIESVSVSVERSTASLESVIRNKTDFRHTVVASVQFTTGGQTIAETEYEVDVPPNGRSELKAGATHNAPGGADVVGCVDLLRVE